MLHDVLRGLCDLIDLVSGVQADGALHHLTLGTLQQLHERKAGHGLAATRLPHESQRLSALDAQRDVVDRVNRVRVEQATGAGLVDDIDIPELDDRLVLAP